MASTSPQNMYDKLWQQHVVEEKAGETPLLYVDRHLIHEVTSPQAFANLKFHNRPVRHPERTVATMDHNISTRSIKIDAAGEGAANQSERGEVTGEDQITARGFQHVLWMTTSKTTFGYVYALWSPVTGVQCTTLLSLIASHSNGW